MKILNSSIFVSLCVIVAAATLAYGTVHQPTLALFYLVMTSVAMIWLIAGWVKGELTFSRHIFQVPLIAAAIYALIQTIPLGSIAETAGVAGIPRTLSLSPFDTVMSALHMLVLALFLGVMLAIIDRARRVTRKRARRGTSPSIITRRGLSWRRPRTMSRKRCARRPRKV